MFPKEIEKHINGIKIKKFSTKYHRSGDVVYNIGNEFILKVSENIDNLEKERKANDLLCDYSFVSKTIEFIVHDNKAYYLKTMVKGNPLVLNKYLQHPEKLVDLLADAINTFHSIDLNLLGLKHNDDEVLVHGDFCLPNILARYNKISGFIDLSQVTVGEPWIDYAWAIWSLEYNLKTDKYTKLFLEKIGIEFDKEKYFKYINL